MDIKVWSGYLQAPKMGFHSNGVPCQDSVHLVETADLLVITLSDGVGSLLHSDIASKTTTLVTADFLLNYNWADGQEKKKFAKKLVEVCRKSVEDEAKIREIEVSQMDCTLLFAVLFKEKHLYCTGQLGDGAICIVRENEAIKLPSISGVKASTNMTKTLFSSNAEEFVSLNSGKTKDLLGILLTSDGLQNELYSNVGDVKSNLQWYYNNVSIYPAEECSALILNRWNDLSLNCPDEFSDDMSLAVIYRPKQQTYLPQDANWLCICGHRNNLESTRCATCSRDFLKLYKGAPYREYGGKKQFFLYMNAHPQKEILCLKKLSMYPVTNLENCCSDTQKQIERIPLNVMQQYMEQYSVDCFENNDELDESNSRETTEENSFKKSQNLKRKIRKIVCKVQKGFHKCK